MGDTRGGPFLGGAVRQRWTWGHQPAVVGHLDGSSSGQRVHALAGLKRTFSGGTVVGLVAGAGFDHASVQVAQFDRVDGWSRWGGSLHMDVVVGYAP